MVSLSVVREHNKSLRETLKNYSHISLFIGVTQGIGLATVVQLLHHIPSPTIFIVGRSASGFASKLGELRDINPSAKIEFIEGEASLLRDVDAICEVIVKKVKKLDLLFMSAGFLPSRSPDYTSENLDKCFSLSYYSRMRFTVNLISLLEKAAFSIDPQNGLRAGPRVVSVLNGGKERHLTTDDLGLRENYSFLNAIDQMTVMNTLAFEYLSRSHPDISFIHEHPGIVRTGIIAKCLDVTAGSSSTIMSRILGTFITIIGRFIILPLFSLIAMSPEQSGERRLFEITNARYASRRTIEEWKKQMEDKGPSSQETSKGPITASNVIHLPPCSVPGSGVYRVISTSDATVKGNAKLEQYRIQNMPEKIWDHTLETFKTALQDG